MFSPFVITVASAAAAAGDRRDGSGGGVNASICSRTVCAIVPAIATRFPPKLVMLSGVIPRLLSVFPSMELNFAIILLGYFVWSGCGWQKTFTVAGGQSQGQVTPSAAPSVALCGPEGFTTATPGFLMPGTFCSKIRSVSSMRLTTSCSASQVIPSPGGAAVEAGETMSPAAFVLK